MAKYDYNMVVIGAGSAGLVTSYVAAAAKAKVALIERHKMGGDCLNTGCVPSKALIRSSTFMRDVKRSSQLGFREATINYDFSDIMERVQRVIQTIEPHDSIERYTNLGVECHTGQAKVISAHEVEVNGKKLSTRTIVIAAGARPFVPPIPGLENVDYYTSDTIWNIREKPERMVIIGGGPIGSELAQAFAYLDVQVTQIEGSPRILVREDSDVSDIVMDHFQHAGVSMMVNCRAQSIHKDEKTGDNVIVVKQADDTEVEVPFDALLLAVGRKPNADQVEGLKEVGVVITPRGAIEVNSKLQTAVPNIYACGDIIGSYQFTHTAAHAAVTVAINALSPLPFKSSVNWSIVPWCTFTHPEVARVGLNEDEAKKSNIEYEVSKYGIDDLDRAIADEEATGFVKLITSPKGKILGVTIVGDHAGDLIHEYIFAMKKKAHIKEVLSMIHIYPTLAEANRFAAGVWSKSHLSAKLLSISEKINNFMRG